MQTTDLLDDRITVAFNWVYESEWTNKEVREALFDELVFGISDQITELYYQLAEHLWQGQDYRG